MIRSGFETGWGQRSEDSGAVKLLQDEHSELVRGTSIEVFLPLLYTTQSQQLFFTRPPCESCYLADEFFNTSSMLLWCLNTSRANNKYRIVG